MEKKIDYKKYAFVYVDDEEKSLEYFKRPNLLSWYLNMKDSRIMRFEIA